MEEQISRDEVSLNDDTASLKTATSLVDHDVQIHRSPLVPDLDDIPDLGSDVQPPSETKIQVHNAQDHAQVTPEVAGRAAGTSISEQLFSATTRQSPGDQSEQLTREDRDTLSTGVEERLIY